MATDHLGYSTPWNHLKKFWYLAGSTATKEKTESAFHFEEDGETVLFKDGAGIFHPITLTEMAHCGTKAAQEAVSIILDALPKECRHLYESFDYRRLVDNLSCWDSIFLQEQNVIYLEPMQCAIEEAVMKKLIKSNGLISSRQAIAWVEKEDRILSAFLAHHLLFTPMSARDFQFKGLSHQGVENEAWPRSLIILNSCICFANPPMKGPKGNRKRAEALWALTVMISNPFAFCMGVLRPIFTKVLKYLKRDISLRDEHIFVHSITQRRRKNPGVFTGPDVNKALQAFTRNLPLKLTAGKLRHFTSVMFQEHFPQLLQDRTKSGDNLVDRLGQHLSSTANTHYSNVLTQSTQLGMLLPTARHYLQLCEVYQASFSIATVSVRSEESVDNSLIFSSKKFEGIAFKEARALVGSLYQLGGNEENVVAQRAQNLLESKPYMVRGYFDIPTTAADTNLGS